MLNLVKFYIKYFDKKGVLKLMNLRKMFYLKEIIEFCFREVSKVKCV